MFPEDVREVNEGRQLLPNERVSPRSRAPSISSRSRYVRVRLPPPPPSLATLARVGGVVRQTGFGLRPRLNWLDSRRLYQQSSNSLENSRVFGHRSRRLHDFSTQRPLRAPASRSPVFDFIRNSIRLTTGRFRHPQAVEQIPAACPLPVSHPTQVTSQAETPTRDGLAFHPQWASSRDSWFRHMRSGPLGVLCCADYFVRTKTNAGRQCHCWSSARQLIMRVSGSAGLRSGNC